MSKNMYIVNFNSEKGLIQKSPKILKVYMITHKRSGLLISKFSLWKFFRYLINFAGVTRQNLVSKGIMILLRRSLLYWLFVKFGAWEKFTLEI